MTPVLTVTDMPSPEATRTIEDGLSIYNRAASGMADARDLAVLITDPESGETLGGLVGRTSLGLLFVDLFHVPEAMRGSGLGSRIMEVAEEEARRRGCVSSFLITINFQAPDFYKRHGYVEMGRVSSLPGISRVVMTKSLV